MRPIVSVIGFAIIMLYNQFEHKHGKLHQEEEEKGAGGVGEQLCRKEEFFVL